MKSILSIFSAVFLLAFGLANESLGSKRIKNAQLDIYKVEIGETVILDGLDFEAERLKSTEVSEMVLKNLTRYLNSNPKVEVEIRAYTDNIGDEYKNLRLSQNRADAVKIWLIKHGIPSFRIDAKGYGSVDPIAPNSTPEGRAQNRRIELYRTK